MSDCDGDLSIRGITRCPLDLRRLLGHDVAGVLLVVVVVHVVLLMMMIVLMACLPHLLVAFEQQVLVEHLVLVAVEQEYLSTLPNCYHPNQMVVLNHVLAMLVLGLVVVLGCGLEAVREVVLLVLQVLVGFLWLVSRIVDLG